VHSPIVATPEIPNSGQMQDQCRRASLTQVYAEESKINPISSREESIDEAKEGSLTPRMVVLESVATKEHDLVWRSRGRFASNGHLSLQLCPVMHMCSNTPGTTSLTGSSVHSRRETLPTALRFGFFLASLWRVLAHSRALYWVSRRRAACGLPNER
jgi:hypothetical protein